MQGREGSWETASSTSGASARPALWGSRTESSPGLMSCFSPSGLKARTPVTMGPAGHCQQALLPPSTLGSDAQSHLPLPPPVRGESRGWGRKGRALVGVNPLPPPGLAAEGGPGGLPAAQKALCTADGAKSLLLPLLHLRGSGWAGSCVLCPSPGGALSLPLFHPPRSL